MPSLFMGEVQYVEDFLADLRALGTDSKFEQLAATWPTCSSGGTR